MKKIVIMLISAIYASAASADFHYILGAGNWGFDNDNNEYVIVNEETHNGSPWIRLVLNTQNNHYHIELDDPAIDYSTLDTLSSYLKDAGSFMLSEHNKAINVFMNSPGGSAEVGLALNDLFQGVRAGHKWTVSARVTGWQECSSACAYAFMGASYRDIGHKGKLGFHASYIVSPLGVRRCDTDSRSDFNKRLTSAYIKRIGNDKGKRLFKETNKCLVGDNLVSYNKHTGKWLMEK